jgi:hypothetical protein
MQTVVYMQTPALPSYYQHLATELADNQQRSREGSASDQNGSRPSILAGLSKADDDDAIAAISPSAQAGVFAVAVMYLIQHKPSRVTLQLAAVLRLLLLPWLLMSHSRWIEQLLRVDCCSCRSRGRILRWPVSAGAVGNARAQCCFLQACTRTLTASAS